MEIILNPDGTRNRDFRPYINMEEYTANTAFYDPNNYIQYGLYDSAQPQLKSWDEYSVATLKSGLIGPQRIVRNGQIFNSKLPPPDIVKKMDIHPPIRVSITQSGMPGTIPSQRYFYAAQ